MLARGFDRQSLSGGFGADPVEVHSTSRGRGARRLQPGLGGGAPSANAERESSVISRMPSAPCLGGNEHRQEQVRIIGIEPFGLPDAGKAAQNPCDQMRAFRGAKQYQQGGMSVGTETIRGALKGFHLQAARCKNVGDTMGGAGAILQPDGNDMQGKGFVGRVQITHRPTPASWRCSACRRLAVVRFRRRLIVARNDPADCAFEKSRRLPIGP